METSFFYKKPRQFALLCIVFGVLISCIAFASEDDKTPQAPVSRLIVIKGGKIPAWMEQWKQARGAASAGDLKAAVLSYEQLLSQKPQIEEALREYCIILMSLKRWQEAGKTVQKLLEIDPSSLEYLLYGGRVDLIQGRYDRASKYLGQVYSLSPTGPYALEALTGQITSLQKLGRLEMAYPLMEQRYLLIPHRQKEIRKLAKYSVKLGHTKKALTYYKTLISEFQGNDNDFLESAALFEREGDVESAVLSWKGYLELHPFYLPFHEKLSSYLLQKGQDSDALKHLLIQIAHGDPNPDLFLQIAKIYLYTEGRPDKALYFYEEYRKKRPDDPDIASEILRIQAVLANDLLVIVENEGAWSLWRDLAKVIPDRLAVYYSMVEQLEKTDKRDELAEVLEIIHFHKPEDQEVLLKLVQLYFDQARYDKAESTLNSLTLPVQQEEIYLKLRYTLSEIKGTALETLKSYKDYLRIAPDDSLIILKSMQLAGDLGLMEEAQHFLNSIADEGFTDPALKRQGYVQYCRILIDNGLFTRASRFYKDVIPSVGLTETEKDHIADAVRNGLQSVGDLFVAEQSLRHTLIREKGGRQILIGLIKNSVLQENWKDAWSWYDYLLDTPEHGKANVEAIETENFLLKIAILEQTGQLSLAIDLLETYLKQVDVSSNTLQGRYVQVGLELAKLYYRVHRYDNTATLLTAFPKTARINPSIAVLRHLLSLKHPDPSRADDVLVPVKIPTIDRFESIRIYLELGEVGIALERCESLLADIPDSVKAKILCAKLLKRKIDSVGPLEIYRDLVSRYPGEVFFKQDLIEALFQSSKFTELIDLLVPEWKPITGGEATMSVRQLVPDVRMIPVQQQILLAKSLWAVHRYDDALLLYHKLLDPAVDQEFAKRLESKGIVLSLPVPQKSFLNSITFTTPAEPDRLSVVMSPSFTLENLLSPEVEIATGLYASYRWQQIVQKELSVRQAMYDQNYYQAMKEYQKLLRNTYSSESLYDLAGVYSRLGFLNREAALYETMKSKSPGYPDLIEASQRNSIKREPTVTPDVDFLKKEGRDGYCDIRQQSYGLSSWIMPSLEHELSVNFSRIYSESLEDTLSQWRNHVDAKLLWNPMYDLGFLFQLGSERLDGGVGSSLLFDAQVNGRMGDMVATTLSISQDIVDDTAQSIAESITATEYEAGLQLDLLPRLFGGGMFRYTEYSDGNHQNRYEFWTSYLIYSEPTLLQVKYSYEYSKNAEGNLGYREGESLQFSPVDYPYWSPREYWQHLFTLSFEHQLGDDIFGRSSPSYYILEYSFGYELGGYDNHRASGQIFLEMNRHFLLNSTVELLRGTDVEEADLFFSVIYRW
jgi:predicted Zn-dependent protease